MRLPIATSLETRDGTLDQDAKIVNGIIEPRGDAAPVVRKRFGLSDLGLVRSGAAQMLTYWNGKVRTIIGDYLGDVENIGPGGDNTFNPSDKSANVTLSNGNLTLTVAASGSARAVSAVTSGTISCAFTVSTVGAASVGVANASASLAGRVSSTANGLTFEALGDIIKNGSVISSGGGAWAPNDVIQVTYNADSRTVAFYKNGVLIYTATGSNVPTGDLYFAAGGYASVNTVITANFGAIASSSNLSPTTAGLQFSHERSGANAPESLLMLKNSTQAWTLDTADTTTQITDVDYPGTYSVTLQSLTRSGTTATATTPVETNFQVGSSVVIAGAAQSDYNGTFTITGVQRADTLSFEPFEVTITRSSTTATATCVSDPHGLQTGDSVKISGANESGYNGTFTVTVTSATTFTFTVTVSTDGPTSPATGSPIFSRVKTFPALSARNTVSNRDFTPYTGGTYATFLVIGFDSDMQCVDNGDTVSIGGQPFLTGTVANKSGGQFEVTGTSATSAYYLSNKNIHVTATLPTISSITRDGPNVTITTSGAHNLSYVSSFFISGCTQNDYNGEYDRYTASLTFPTSTTIKAVRAFTTESPETPATGTIKARKPDQILTPSFTYTVANSPATPATGTITATGGRSTVPGIAYLNGYFCVMDEFGVIYNCAQDDPSQWNALEYTTALNEPGAGMAIAKTGSYIAAFKEWSTEFFYDAGNAIGSPLSPVDNGFTLIGCANGWSVANVDGALMWISQSKRHKGRGIYMMRGTEQQKVSTPAVDRVLNADDLATVYAWGANIDGHPIYVLTLVTSDVTLVYDMLSQSWTVFSSLAAASSVSVSSITRSGTTATVTTATSHGLSDGDPVLIAGASQSDYNGIFQVLYGSSTTFTIEVANSPATPATGTITATPYNETRFKHSHYTEADGTDVVLHVSDGHLYEIDTTLARDNGVPINFFARTAKIDGGDTRLKKIGALRIIGDRVDDTAVVRWTDDDGTTFVKYRRVDLDAKQAELRRCGSFRRRWIEFRHTGNTVPRVSEIEMDTGG